MTHDHADLLVHLQRAWNDHDLDLLESLFTEDCVYEDFAMAARHEGHPGLREFATEVFATMPDFHLELRRTGVGPDAGVSEWTITATWSGSYEGVDRTGTAVEFSGLSMYEFDGGLIRRNSDCWDSVQVHRSMRVVPAALRFDEDDRGHA